MAHASASWMQMSDSAFYRKEDVYSMQWSLPGDLSDYRMAVASCGGPLALMREESKPVVVRSGNAVWGSRPQIAIYNSAGGLLKVIPWDLPTKPVRFGFTKSESLVVVLNDGSYRIYRSLESSTSSSPPHASYTTHSLGNEAADTGVIDARIYEDGMVVILGSLSAIHLKGWSDESEQTLNDSKSSASLSTIEKLPDLDIDSVPTAWDIIPSETSSIHAIQLLLPQRNTILVVDPIDVQDQRFERGPFTHIFASPNGRFVALVNSDNNLFVVSSDFSRVLLHHDLSKSMELNDSSASSKVINQMVWCGNDTIVCTCDEGIFMVGPFGETLTYWYTEPVFLAPEIDGTRVFTTESCEFLQKVPDSTSSVFRPGSALPAAILYEASDLFYKKNPKSDEMIRSIKADLTNAVDTCIDAAGKELHVNRQRSLMKAASFGKTFLDSYDASTFIKMAQSLRVLNACRYYEIGISITYEQYRQRSPDHVIRRLTLRSHHLLALRIATFLNLPTSPVLSHWAFDKVSKASGRGDLNDADLVDSIVDTLKDQNDVSCADVAKTAWDQGKRGLATKLLEHETKMSKQVPLLLSMGENNSALQKAIDSGNPDLVLEVLINLRRNHSLGTFLLFIDNKPDATALLQVYAKENDIELLRDFYYQDDRRTESACLALSESVSTKSLQTKISKIKSAQKSFNEDKERVFENKMTEEQLRLITYQQQLEQEGGPDMKKLVGLSVNETIRFCIVYGWPKKAEKIKSEFKVPDKRYWYVKMKALCEVRDFEGLETFAKSRRSPIGYEPFVNYLIKIGQQRQAIGFVERCDSKSRVDLYVKCGEWLRAGKECQIRSERGRLIDLRQKAPNSIIAAQLDRLLEEMGSF